MRLPFRPRIETNAANPSRAAVPAAEGRVRKPSQPGEGQWALLEYVVHEASATVARVAVMQSSASRQLDAAGYALHQLLAELSTVMTLPAKPHTAKVVRLEVPAAKSSAPFRRKPAVAA
jgi:hypothetical protein